MIKVPYTPESELASRVRAVTTEEGERLGLRVKVQEGGGTPLRRSLVNTDLSAGTPCPQGDCPLCLTGEGKGGLRHHRAGQSTLGTAVSVGRQSRSLGRQSQHGTMENRGILGIAASSCSEYPQQK